VYHVQLPSFEGPLDLLLHLIQNHQLDIFDIPIRFITERYLLYLSLMHASTIEIGSEYLVMAAVLAHIKSKMLLPTPPPEPDAESDDEGLDPREELVRRLLDYQRYKHAAAELQNGGFLGQDALTRPPPPAEAHRPGPLASVPVFSLLDALAKLLERKKIRLDHEVTFERLSITDRIHELIEMFRTRRTLSFTQLFDPVSTRFDLVITFLALLEMTKLGMTRLMQTELLADLYIELCEDAILAEELLAR